MPRAGLPTLARSTKPVLRWAHVHPWRARVLLRPCPRSAPMAEPATTVHAGRVAEPAVAVRLEGLHKRFGHVEAVRGVDLEIADGEFFSMLGPSGSGKTTVLRMIAGFETPTAGRVPLGGPGGTRAPPVCPGGNTGVHGHAPVP